MSRILRIVSFYIFLYFSLSFANADHDSLISLRAQFLELKRTVNQHEAYIGQDMSHKASFTKKIKKSEDKGASGDYTDGLQLLLMTAITAFMGYSHKKNRNT